MNELKTSSTHELLRDLEVNVFTSVKSKEKEWSKKAKPFCKKADAKFKGRFRSSIVFYRDILIHSKKYYKIKDFNAIVDFIVQEKLLVPTIDPLPKIDMNEVESYALQSIEQGPLNFKK